MKKLFVLIIIAFSILFFACEDEVIPIPLPPSQPAANVPVEENTELQVPAEKPSEPAKTAKTSAKISAKEPPAKTITYFENGDIEQLRTGRYVIQVAIFPVETSAKKLIKKLAENGIKAYNAKVQNPDPEKGMIGTYHRVRIGFFEGRGVAEAFARARLEPIGYAWWIDRSKNDNIGKLTTAEPEPEPFVVERIQEPKQMSEQERREAERAAAIAAAKEEYKAIAKAANAAVSIPPPKIPAKPAKAAPPPAAQAPAPKLAPPPKAPPPASKAAPPSVSKTPASAKEPATKEAEIDSRGKVKMKSRR